VLLGGLTLLATIVRLALPLVWLRREIPTLRVRRRFVSRARVRELLAFSWSNFLVHIAQKIVFSTDVVVVGIVLGSKPAGVYNIPANLFAIAFGVGTAATSLMFPAFAELEGSGALERQRRLLVTGLRGGTALMAMLALPLILIPDLLIHGWLGNDQYRGAYAVMAILAGVLLVHQPIYVFTQFLIARARQREVAVVSIVTALANLVLSILLAWTWGLQGVAVATLATDLAAVLWIVPRFVAPSADVGVRRLATAAMQPLAAAIPAALLVLVALARVWSPKTLPELAVVGVAWAVAAGASLWWLGLDGGEREALRRQARPRRAEPAQAAGM
jgi:O-antigen/teichoic acid export membrane protein